MTPRLFTEQDRSALNRIIDQLENQLVTTIIEKVFEGATPLFRRGYRLHEVEILGFGPEITVEPVKKLSRSRLWWRRVLLYWCILKQPTLWQYGQIACRERDTQRLIEGLRIFDSRRGADMSVESDRAAVIAAYPSAHLVTKTSTGGSRIIQHVIQSGAGEDRPVGPQAFSEAKAWQYAAERLQLKLMELKDE